MNHYETVFILNPVLSDDQVKETVKKFEDFLVSNGAKMISKEDWGLKELSFNINNYKKAFYKFYQIEMNGSKIQNLKRILSQNEKILRHLFVKVEEHQELPTKMMDNEEK